MFKQNKIVAVLGFSLLSMGAALPGAKIDAVKNAASTFWNARSGKAALGFGTAGLAIKSLKHVPKCVSKKIETQLSEKNTSRFQATRKFFNKFANKASLALIATAGLFTVQSFDGYASAWNKRPKFLKSTKA
jgi:ABC-type glycerol-3-phosphate transport system permease component